MDDWIYPYSDLDSPSPQPALVDQDWHAIEDRRVREEAEAAGRAADLEQTEAMEGVGDSHTVVDLPFPLATPVGVALTF